MKSAMAAAREARSVETAEVLNHICSTLPAPAGHQWQFDRQHELTWLSGNPGPSLSAYVRPAVAQMGALLEGEIRIFPAEIKAIVLLSTTSTIAGETKPFGSPSGASFLYAPSLEDLKKHIIESLRTSFNSYGALRDCIVGSAHVEAGVNALRSDWRENFTDDALADAADAAQQVHGALPSFTDVAALESAIKQCATDLERALASERSRNMTMFWRERGEARSIPVSTFKDAAEFWISHANENAGQTLPIIKSAEGRRLAQVNANGTVHLIFNVAQALAPTTVLHAGTPLAISPERKIEATLSRAYPADQTTPLSAQKHLDLTCQVLSMDIEDIRSIAASNDLNIATQWGLHFQKPADEEACLNSVVASTAAYFGVKHLDLITEEMLQEAREIHGISIGLKP